MKYILVLLVVVLGIWMLLRGRGSEAPKDPPPQGRRRPTPPGAIVACAHCDLRLPDSEALTGADGLRYCSDAHRLSGPR